MPCGECDRLRRENRELKEEIAEYGKSMIEGQSPLAFTIKTRLSLRPASAKVLACLIENAGRVVSNRALATAADYSGEATNPNDSRAMSAVGVAITHCRRALEDVGIYRVIHTFYGEGRTISKEDAAKVRALL